MRKYLLFILSIIGATAFYFNSEKVKLKEEEWFTVKGEIIESTYKTHLGGTIHGVEPVIHDYVFTVEYELNSLLISKEYAISGKAWGVDEKMEGQAWKDNSGIDVYINRTNHSKILLNPKFNKSKPMNWVVYGFCGLFAFLGLAQILGTDVDTPKNKVKLKKKKKPKKKKNNN